MFTLPNLPYDYDALGSYISKDIMALHHGKHHAGHVEKLNLALENNKELLEKDIEGILREKGIALTV